MISMTAGQRNFQKAKPFTLHCCLLVAVLLYAFLGGVIFNRLEASALIQHRQTETEQRRQCVAQILANATVDEASKAGRIVDCWKREADERTEWSYMTATLYGFGIVTTLGYNRIAPITYAGRMFCIVYGICGIPITMIIIANVGQYLNQFAGNSRKRIEQYRDRRRRSRASFNGDDYSDSSIEITSLALLIIFLLYVSFGALLLPLLNGKIDFFNGLYYNFLCLTAIDFGQLVPQRVAFLPITFLYVVVGLAITTIAIDVGSEYMKKLHYLGKRMKDVATTRVWFGGKTMKVRDLLHAVGKKCGIDPNLIDRMDLENIVERAVAINEGREPPPDTNLETEENVSEKDDTPLLTQPPSTPRFSSKPPSRASSIASSKKPPPSPAYATSLKLFDLEEIIPIDMELPEPVTLAHIEELPGAQFVREFRLLIEPESRSPTPPPATPDIKDEAPKKFKEKKERYGRDPQKLYETYMEEWERLDRLSDRRSKPTRRKSLLTLSSSNLAKPESEDGD